MSIDDIPKNDSGKNLNREAERGGCSPWLVGFLVLGCVVGVSAINRCQRIHERELESHMKYEQRMQDLGDGLSKNYNPPIVPLLEERQRQELQKLESEIKQKELDLKRYKSSSYDE